MLYFCVLDLMKMQEQQQQHFKTILGTNGPYSYFGLHLPQQPVNVTNTEAGDLSAKNTGSENCIVSVEPALKTPANTTAFPASTMSSLIDYLNVSSTSKSTLSSSVSISPIASTSTSLSNNATTSISNTVVSNVTNNLNTSPRSDQSFCKTTETGKASSIVGNVSSSTSKTSSIEKTNDNEFQNQKSPAPPSRMVTRSQTAAERMQPSLAEGSHSKTDHQRARKHVRTSGSDLEEEYSPCKVKREMLSASGIVFDDFAYGKSPSGAGIDFAAVCADCGVVAVTSVGWTAHQQAHRNEGSACIYCNQVFLTDQGRQIHQQLHRDGQTRDVDDFCECGICGGSFISILYLELHLLELHGREALGDQRSVHLGPSSNSDPSCTPEDESGRQLYRCGVCRSPFTFSLNLDCHMALHSEVSYCCAVCDAAFPTLDPLVTHSKGHRFIGHMPTQAGVQVHMAATPMPPRPPQCPMFQPVTNPSFSTWKPQPIRNTFYPRSTLTQTTATAPTLLNSPMTVKAPMNVQASHSNISKVTPQSALSKANLASPSGASVMTTSVTQPAAPTVMPTMAPMMSSPMMTPMSQMMAPSMAPAMTPVMTAPMTPAMLNYCMMMSLWGGGNKACGNQGGIPMWQNYMNPSMANVINYFNPYLLNNHMMNNSSGTNDVNHSFQSPCCKQDNSSKEQDQESTEVGAKSDSCVAEESANVS